MQYIGGLAQQVRKSAIHDGEPRRCDYEALNSFTNTNDESSGGFIEPSGSQSFSEVDLNDTAEFSKQGLLGAKRIALFGSIVCVANNIAGPGMVVLPRVYQEAGWVVPSAVLVVVCVASSLAATYLVDAMARIPGNSRFQRRIEFVNIFDEYWGATGMQIAQAMFIINMMAQTVSSIVANAQVVDSFIVFLNPYRTTYALEVFPHPHFISWSPPLEVIPAAAAAQHSREAAALCHEVNAVPFADLPGAEGRLLVSLGYVFLALLLVPMSNMNLDDNVIIQKVSFYMLVVLSIEFLVQFWAQGLTHHTVPAFGTNYSHVVGSILFNYAFIAIIPSWLNEKRQDVSVNLTVWTSTVGSTVLYILTGLMGACAYTRAEGNFLNALSNECSPLVTRVSAFLFAFGIIGLGIPFNCIVTRYSLLVGRVCGPRSSSFWAVWFPWLVSWLVYGGGLFNEVIAWSGDLDLGPINFVLPIMVSLTAVGVGTWGFRGKADKEARPSGEAAPKYGLAQIAQEEDEEDEVNRPTSVEPLPPFLRRWQRPIGAAAAALLCLGILASVVSHSSRAFGVLRK